MEFKLKSFTFSGIKNIKEPMTFDFYKKKRDSFKNEDFEKSTIKSIYGPNGVGKTAFIEAIALYKSFLHENNVVQSHSKIIDGLLNKKSNEIKFECCLILKKSKEIRHIVVVEKINNKYEITEETFLCNDKIVYKTLNGEIVESKFGEDIIKKSMNLLNTSTFISFYISKYHEFEKINMDIIKFIYATFRITIFSESKDDHSDFYLNKEFASIGGDIEKSLDEIVKSDLKFSNNTIKDDYVGDILMSKDREIEFIKKINKLEKFIKIFKPEIRGININKKEKGDYIVLRLSYRYDIGNVDFEFESVGIKKLHVIFNMLERVSKGEIIIVDELDAHIHDVVYNNILEYIIRYTNGQFIFTTHNLSSMNILKSINNSIDIIDLDKNVITWKQSGNLSPISAYKGNLLTNFDFKYDEIDFLEVFDGH